MIKSELRRLKVIFNLKPATTLFGVLIVNSQMFICDTFPYDFWKTINNGKSITT